jgi:CBS domain-containing protein
VPGAATPVALLGTPLPVVVLALAGAVAVPDPAFGVSPEEPLAPPTAVPMPMPLGVTLAPLAPARAALAVLPPMLARPDPMLLAAPPPAVPPLADPAPAPLAATPKLEAGVSTAGLKPVSAAGSIGSIPCAVSPCALAPWGVPARARKRRKTAVMSFINAASGWGCPAKRAHCAEGSAGASRASAAFLLSHSRVPRAEAAMFVDEVLRQANSHPSMLPPDARLPEAASLLRKDGSKAILVHDGPTHSEPVGIVTERCIIDGLAHYGEAARLIELHAIMNKEFIACRPDDRLEDVMRRMLDRQRRHVLVMQDGHMLGILSIDSMLLFLLDAEKLEKDLLRDYFLGLGYH